MMDLPTLQAFLVCDMTYQDKETNKFVICGPFTQIGAPKFPVVHPSSAVYARVLGVSGKTRFRLRIVDLSTNAAMGESGPIEAEIRDPVVGGELAIRLPPLRFDHAGAYSVEFLWGETDRPLGDWRFELIDSKVG